ncbi:MAG: right-handed parallel beta-helix repeat-containing protein, partial [Planctomycetes bacterium]|nr:right-handed parallel beta-helix repeat-containing protein [Planctomycetota bacterium]
MLEPRILLSAEPLPVEPPAPAESVLGTSAVIVDLDHAPSNPSGDSSALLTYFTSSDGTGISTLGATSSEGAEAGTEASSSSGQTVQPLDTDHLAASILASEVTLSSIPAEQIPSGVHVYADAEKSTAYDQSSTACSVPMDRQEYLPDSQSLPITSRGPPAETGNSVTRSYCGGYDGESKPDELRGGSIDTGTALTAPALPGLELIDPDPAPLAGQIIYLDFDGAEEVIYNGPITVGPFDIPAFQAPGELAGQEQALILQMLMRLEEIFAGSGVIFTTSRPSTNQPYSTIYIGGDDSAFAQYGSFLGLAEQVDVGNADRSDGALVFAAAAALWLHGLSADTLVAVVAHEVGHLLGYAHVGSSEAGFTAEGQWTYVAASNNRSPSIGSLTASPDPVVKPNNLTLTANNVTDPDVHDAVTTVEFYRDSNDNGVWDAGIDVTLGRGTSTQGGWAWTGATDSFPVGTNRYFARAYDGQNWSEAITTTGVVQPPIVTHTVTVIQPAHGTIAPAGAVSVTHGVPYTFAITPDPGYTVADVTTAGVSQGPMTSFTYYGILYDTTLTAYMMPTPNSTAETIYVDNLLSADITNGTYSIANRNGSGHDGNAYTTIGKASYVAGPGDTIYIRAGTYNSASPLPGDILWPRVSGTAEHPITFTSYNHETVVLGDGAPSWPSDYLYSIARAPICMRNVSYITIDGLIIRGTAGWFWARGCTQITVQNCAFYDSQWDAKGTARFIDSSYCAFRHCLFQNSSYDGMVLLMSDHITVEGCTFDKAVHSCLSLRSASYCVIRNNSFRNPYYNNGNAEKLVEIFDAKVDTTDPLSPTYIPVPGYNHTQHNLLENNFFGYHPDYDPSLNKGSRTAAIQFSGQTTIIRGNIFSNPLLAAPDPNGGVAGGVGIVWRWGGSWSGWSPTLQKIVGEGHEAGFVWGNRVYNNTFYGNDGGQMTFPTDTAVSNLPSRPPVRNVENYVDYPFTDTYRFDDNVIVNNVFTGGSIVPHIDWTSLVMCKGMPVQMFITGRRAQTFWETNDFYAPESDPNHDNLIYEHADYPYQAPQTPAWYNAHLPTNFIGNIQQDPRFVSLPLGSGLAYDGNFHLQAASGGIDAGSFVTAITSATGRGAQFTVADPGYFYDGYGISQEQGDLIKLSNGQMARIVRINYANGTITLDRTVSWGNGEKVSLAYEGNAPDLGAYEYILSAVRNLAVSGTSPNSLTLTWTVPGEEGMTGTPTQYDLRYATGPITEATWDTATQVQGESVPGSFGTRQSYTITGLNSGATYYVGIKTHDEMGHISSLSNMVSAATTAPEITVLGQGLSIVDGDTSPSLTDGTDFGKVAVGGTAITRTFTVRNDGAATLTLGVVVVPTGFTLLDGLVASLAGPRN